MNELAEKSVRQRPTFALTGAEIDIVGALELDPSAVRGFEAHQRNSDLAAALSRSLIARRAIPAARVRWFLDPDCNPGGRGASRRDIFERNGTSGEAIRRHASFLCVLRYFLYGPDLPASAAAAFVEDVDRCGPVTSGDVVPLGKRARELTRNFGIEANRAADEFFKLTLELGISASYAAMIRSAVRQIRISGQ